MKNPILEAKGISKSFGNIKALDDVDFFLEKGIIHGLLGENGAGKSSLMNILSGIYIPEKGTLTINGQLIKRLNPDLASSYGIGMVHQEFRLIDSFSIKDNLTLSKSNIYQHDFSEAFSKYSDIFALNLNAMTPVSELSVGEKQKVEIMKLIFHNSSIMLLDEPTVGLDIGSRQLILRHVKTLCKKNKLAVLWATHLIDEIDKGEKVVVINKGKILESGEVGEIIKKTKTKNIRESFNKLVGIK